MPLNRCLYCYLPMGDGQTDFHPACSRKIFGTPVAPLLPYTEDQMNELALKVVQGRVTLTGVQPKLSLDIYSDKNTSSPKRFTIVGLWGGYILKPPTVNYLHLPEVEDLTMHLAAIAGIATVPHSLIRMQSGNLAYITQRIDRVKKDKLHMEDMCQLTERLTEDKYHGSYEQIARAIIKYAENPLLDTINFFEQVVFSFLTGNADMHLKNFSLIGLSRDGYQLAPAYDMVATALVNPKDDEDLALTLNGKKKKLKRSDFTAAFNTPKLDARQQVNLFNKMEKAIPRWIAFIDNSFLNEEMKTHYKELIRSRQQRLFNE